MGTTRFGVVWLKMLWRVSLGLAGRARLSVDLPSPLGECSAAPDTVPGAACVSRRTQGGVALNQVLAMTAKHSVPTRAD